MPTMDSQRGDAAVSRGTRLRMLACHASSFSAAPRKARLLGERLAKRGDLDVTLSLAGRTAAPVPHAGAGPRRRLWRRRGLAPIISPRERIDALIDATHPYATVISQNAAAAARDTDVPFIGAAPAAVDAPSPATAGSR